MSLQLSQVRSNIDFKRWAIAIPVAIVAVAAALTLRAGAESGVVTVTPTDTQGWHSADTRGAGAINYVADATSPYPSGALQLTTGSSNVDKAQYMKDVTVPLADITQLSYDTKQVSGPATADPSFQLEVNLNGASGGFTTLVYEPYWNGVVTPGAWQSWDVDAGQFWSSRTVAPLVVSGAGGPPFYTLAELKAAYPDAIVTSFGVNVGSYNPDYNVETDGVGFNGTTYDFELKPMRASSKDQCKNDGWMNFAVEYKNQGQCVSDTVSSQNSKQYKS